MDNRATRLLVRDTKSQREFLQKKRILSSLLIYFIEKQRGYIFPKANSFFLENSQLSQYTEFPTFRNNREQIGITMSEQLAYVAITPRSLEKERTGAILARLISRTGLNWVGACMFAPSNELARDYAAVVRTNGHSVCKNMRQALGEYIEQNFAPCPKTGRKKRVLVLLFQGEDAIRKISQAVGDVPGDPLNEKSIRETYGDIVFADGADRGTPVYFEPAAITAINEEGTRAALNLWVKFSNESGVLQNTVQYPDGATPEITLAMMKPDNFRFASARPGYILDFLAQTGLNLIGMRVQHMTTAQALDFYGPVREVLCSRLTDKVAEMAKPVVEKVLETSLGEDTVKKLGQLLCPSYGNSQFDDIVRFMSGRSFAECQPEELKEPGLVQSVVLIYEGVNAIAKVRKALGATNPSKAEPGTVRREFGSNMMVNTAHASDSPESVKREMDILVYSCPNGFKSLCEKFV